MPDLRFWGVAILALLACPRASRAQPQGSGGSAGGGGVAASADPQQLLLLARLDVLVMESEAIRKQQNLIAGAISELGTAVGGLGEGQGDVHAAATDLKAALHAFQAASAAASASAAETEASSSSSSHDTHPAAISALSERLQHIEELLSRPSWSDRAVVYFEQLFALMGKYAAPIGERLYALAKWYSLKAFEAVQALFSRVDGWDTAAAKFTILNNNLVKDISKLLLSNGLSAEHVPTVALVCLALCWAVAAVIMYTVALFAGNALAYAVCCRCCRHRSHAAMRDDDDVDFDDDTDGDDDVDDTHTANQSVKDSKNSASDSSKTKTKTKTKPKTTKKKKQKKKNSNHINDCSDNAQ